MSFLTNKGYDLDTAAASVVNALPRLDLFGQRLSLELYRLLAVGKPVRSTELAERVGLAAEAVDQTLRDWPGAFFDSQQRVVGYWGLSLPSAYDGPHRLMIEGRRLSAWCAWDTLFLPELLNETVWVESTSPVAGATVRLTVSTRSVESLSSPDARMSFLLPDPGALQKDILSAFCCFVHFFPSREAGESWTAQHPGTFLLSIEDGFALARRKNKILYEAVLE